MHVSFFDLEQEGHSKGDCITQLISSHKPGAGAALAQFPEGGNRAQFPGPALIAAVLHIPMPTAEVEGTPAHYSEIQMNGN